MTPTPADIREQLRAATRVQHAVLGQAPDDCIIVRATARWSHVQQAATIDLQLSSLTSLAAARAFAERLHLTADDVADEHERLGYRYGWTGTYAELTVGMFLYTHETDPVTIPAPVARMAGTVSPLDVAAAIARHRHYPVGAL